MKKAILMMSFLATAANAQWLPNGTPVCDTSTNGTAWMLQQIASDDRGGAYVCWRDLRNGNSDIYAQHISSEGRMLWPRNGIAIVADSGDQMYPRIIKDSRGGAFIAWEDSRSRISTLVYVQRIDESGRELWAHDGVKVAETGGFFISLAGDGKGGLLLAWNAFVGDSSDVCVQRLDSLGNRQWPDSGVMVTNRAGAVWTGDVAVTSDGAGGAVVVWSEGPYGYYQVYVQRVDSSGHASWSQNGIQLSDSVYNIDVAISGDHAGGTFVSWSNERTCLKYVQRINSKGEMLWTQGGVILGSIEGGGAQRHTDDQKGGLFVGHSRWIQHIDGSGTKLWGGDGAVFTDAQLGFTNSVQVASETGGIFNFWTDVTSLSTSEDIRGQYIDPLGVARWGTTGLAICDTIGVQDYPKAVTDGKSGAIIVWEDFRNNHSNVYVARVDTSGRLTKVRTTDEGTIPWQPELQQNFPNPFNPTTTISYYLPKRSYVRLTVTNILGQRVLELVDEVQMIGRHETRFCADGISSGAYFYTLVSGQFSVTKKMVLLH
jgi:hypothetical protein